MRSKVKKESGSTIRTFQNLITTSAEMATCSKCFKNIWVAQYLGFKVQVEPNPSDLAREAIARIQGRRIFQTHREIYSFKLQIRALRHILANDPIPKVLIEHDCQISPFAPFIDFYARAAKELPEGMYPF